MASELQSVLEASGIQWPALRNHITCIGHALQLAVGSFTNSLGVKGRSTAWGAHEHDPHFGEKESIDLWKSERLCKEGNARINMVLAIRPGLGKIIQKVCIS
jgi:hypothetical protein